MWSLAGQPRLIGLVKSDRGIRGWKKYIPTNNPYGIENIFMDGTVFQNLEPTQKSGSDNTRFIWNLNHSTEWTDFELALQVLTEFGAKPLILSGPLTAEYGAQWE